MAVRTMKDVSCVALVLGNEGARREIKFGPTLGTSLLLHPEKILHDGILGTADSTSGPIE
jgi:hypothetical protein